MMTFLQFQATRRVCDDLAAHPELDPSFFLDENGRQRVAPGFVYSGDCYIETAADGSFYLQIYRDEYASSDLQELERHLYAWCRDEDFWGDYPVTVERLADAFAHAVRAALTPDQLAVVMANPANSPFCLTHDYIDSNQTMIDVYAEMTGDEPDVQDDKTMALIADAWTLCCAAGWRVESVPAVAPPRVPAWGLEPMTSEPARPDGRELINFTARAGFGRGAR